MPASQRRQLMQEKAVTLIFAAPGHRDVICTVGCRLMQIQKILNKGSIAGCIARGRYALADTLLVGAARIWSICLAADLLSGSSLRAPCVTIAVV